MNIDREHIIEIAERKAGTSTHAGQILNVDVMWHGRRHKVRLRGTIEKQGRAPIWESTVINYEP